MKDKSNRILSDTLHNKFSDLASKLAPENLYRDGEASETEVNQKLTSLKKQWRYLEYLVGRQVSEDEILDKEYANIKVLEKLKATYIEMGKTNEKI